jgi:hypothetical protein
MDCLTAEELKQICQNRGLKTSGAKQELIERILGSSPAAPAGNKKRKAEVQAEADTISPVSEENAVSDSLEVAKLTGTKPEKKPKKEKGEDTPGKVRRRWSLDEDTA